MRIAWLSPLPPARTGIAHYSAIVLPALRQRFDVTAFDSAGSYDRDAFDVAVYQLGNNPHHEWIYREALQRPGIAVLHDVVLHHLIVEMTLARGDASGYVEALRASHGEAGAAWARGRAAGLHSEMGNFLLPASIDLARRSSCVVVHNRWAADLLRSFGVGTPLVIAPHPIVPSAGGGNREAVRARLGIARDDRVVGFFGFLTSAKRAEAVLDAFAKARVADPRLKLLIVGEPAPNIDVAALRAEGVSLTGYVADDEFDAYYAASDLLVNLRYPSAGETSGTLIRAFGAGKPVAVSNYAQFAEYPDEVVVKIDLGGEEIRQLTSFFGASYDVPAIAAAQRRWLETNARLDQAVEAYARAVASTRASGAAAPRRQRHVPTSIPLAIFPRLELVTVECSGGCATLEIRNGGETTLCARSYSTPAYRVLAKIFEGDAEIASHWLQLPGDLHPGATARLTMPFQPSGRAATLRLFDALQSIPLIEPEAWAWHELSA